jgi:hypothetical protein
MQLASFSASGVRELSWLLRELFMKLYEFFM